jgi:putative nucleotidyltransferase with HDIG domain
MHVKDDTPSADKQGRTTHAPIRWRPLAGALGAAVERSEPHMLTAKLTRRLFWMAEGLLLAGAVGTAAWMSRAEEWKPLALVGLLLALTLAGERLDFTIRGQHLSAGFVALVLAMTLLGPAPAVMLGVGAMVLTTVVRRLSAAFSLGNLSTHAVFPLVGGLMVLGLVGDVHDPRNLHLTQSVTFGLVAFAVFMVTNTLNFAQVALDNRIVEGQSLSGQVRDLFIPLLPGQIATGALAAVLAVAYTNLGLPVLLGSVLVIVIFQYLMIALLRSEDRADQLEARSIHLASLQLGVLTTLVETLALRDRSTARHAAAVARYARELAREIGCSEADQDLVHTAGLLHDIGKFALPDHILHAEILSDEDWAVIRRHPQDGATLVGRLDGYGPVADAILYHHEHVDGSGYPAGLIGNEIPLTSRILAVCSTYDTLTARETYRSPMTPQDAMVELRKVAGRQLDPELVSSFIAMLEREGPVTFAHGDDADFEAELAFGRRTRKIAQPSPG